MRAAVCALLHVCMRVCVCAPALTSLLSSLQPPHSDSPVTERPDNLPRSPHQLPCSCSSRLALSTTSPPLHSLLSVSPSTLSFLIRPSLCPLSFFHFTHLLFPFLLVFVSRPLVWCVGLPCLSSCSLRPPCCLSLSLWKPRVDMSGSEVCETLIQTILDHTLTFLSRRATCLQLCAHERKPAPCVYGRVCDSVTTCHHT